MSYDPTRVTLKLKNPNPKFVSWMEEWLEYATKHNLKSQRNLQIALESLKKFPIPLANGEQCKLLQGFGTTICQMIDQRIQEEEKSTVPCSTNAKPDKLKKYRSPMKVDSQTLEPSPKKAKLKEKFVDNIEDDHSFIMSPGSFKIILLVDTHEISGKLKQSNDSTLNALNEENLMYEIRKLNIGDFAWICRDEKGRELILPYIIERKRMDDFASSIKDGRYHEQKYRLNRCGINNIIYLIESYKNNHHLCIPYINLYNAAVNTQIHNNFNVKYTEGHLDTILYLSTMTATLIKKFKDKVLVSCSKEELKPIDLKSGFIPLMQFNEFNTNSLKLKKFTVRQLFIKQLLIIKYLTVDKAMAITKLYPTPKSLILGYQNCTTEQQKENLIKNLEYGTKKLTIGYALSKSLYKYFNAI